MITIKVVAFSGHAPAESLSAEFDELGGSIGRGEGNTLVLSDPERHISRTHASITFHNGRYVIHDRGSATPVQVNGNPLGQGREAPIGNGDELTIGSYTLRVEEKRVQDNRVVPFGQPAPAGGPAKDDPLALFGEGKPSKDPFSDLISPAGRAKPPSSPTPSLIDDPFAAPASKPGHGGGGIPADFDPFADLNRPAPSVSGGANLPDDFDLGLGPSSANQNIDELFGLGPGASNDPFAPGSPLSEPVRGPGSPASVDPLAALSGAPAAHARANHQSPPQRNDVAELHGHFQPPQAKPDPAMETPASPPETPKPASAESGMVLSWDEHGTGSGEIKTMIITPRRRDQEELAPLPSSAQESRVPAKDMAPTPSVPADPLAMFGGASSAADPLGIKQPSASPAIPAKPVQPTADSPQEARTPALAPSPSRPAVAPAPPASKPAVAPLSAAAPASLGQDDLLRAFLTGAGVPDLNLPGGLTPETMHMLGTVLREAMQGTLDLLLARAMIKREVRAEMTMIVARENNPLKFSPNVEAALTHLLAQQARGFMPPVTAMKDAYDDLRSHQFGFMAGMRAALAGVLLRFNPGQLERRLSEKSVLDSLLPMNRKAKLWNLFEDLYGDISKEAEEDFHALFGKEFVRAYEAQIEKLEREESKK